MELKKDIHRKGGAHCGGSYDQGATKENYASNQG